MATLHFPNGSNDVRVFTPISTALSNLPNSGGTIVAMVKRPTVGAAGSDYAGLMNSAGTNWYHTISTGLGGGGQKLGDDDGLIGPVQITAGAQNDSTNWHFFCVSWPTGGAALDRFHYSIVGGSFTHENSSANNGGNRAGPGTGGFMRIGSCFDSFSDVCEIGLVAVWNVEFADGDFAAWAKTSDLWNHSKGRPIFLVEGTSLTPVDLTGGSTYSAANSVAATLTLTGSDPSPWTFDQLGPTGTPTIFQSIPRRMGPKAVGPTFFAARQQPNPPATADIQTGSQSPLLVTPPQAATPGKTITQKGVDGIVRATPLPPVVIDNPIVPARGQVIAIDGLDGLAPASPRAQVITPRPPDTSTGTVFWTQGTGTLVAPTTTSTPPLIVTRPAPDPPVPTVIIAQGTGTLVITPTVTTAPLIVTAQVSLPAVQTLLRRGTDNAIQIGTITPQPTIISARSAIPLPEILIVKGGITSVQVEASGTTGIVFGSTAIPTVSASGTSAIIFNATGVPTESAIGTSTIIFNSTGAGTTPGGVSTFMAMRGANSAFVNVASATTDAAFTGGIIPAAKAGQCVNVLAVTFNADTAADTLVFNSKGAGAGTAISALFSNPINGSVVWPYAPVGWFTTNGGEALTVTTTGASPTHVQVLFEYINA